MDRVKWRHNCYNASYENDEKPAAHFRSSNVAKQYIDYM